MSSFKQEVNSIIKVMNDTDSIRNMSIIAHVDHGKTTLADNFIGHGSRQLDTDDQEAARGVTIKSTAISLIYSRTEKISTKAPINAESKENNEESDNIPQKIKLLKSESKPSKNQESTMITKKYLINLIDSPGHIEFSAEVTGALRLTDGALVVVDCIEGPKCQTETVLKQAIQEGVKPVLFLNKLDRVFGKWCKYEDLYDNVYTRFRHIVEKINVTIGLYCKGLSDDANEEKDNGFSGLELRPELGMVEFGSGLQGWAFTLEDFARMYYNEELTRKLMGKHAKVSVFSTKKNKWYQGEIKKIIKEKGQEWLNVAYKRENGEIIMKQVQRYSKEIKPLNNFVDKNASLDQVCARLWGENYWLQDKQEWWPKKIGKKKKNEKIPENAKHGFTYFVLYPLLALYNAISSGKPEQYTPLVDALKLNLTKKTIENEINKYGMMKGRNGYYSLIMKTWMPARKSLFNMVINHLPSPKSAQNYRINRLYTGNLQSNESKSMKKCDKNSPVCAFVSKSVYFKGSLVSVCRVFSGVLRPNQSLSVMDSNYIPGETRLLTNVKVQRIMLFGGKDVAGIDECPAGNVCGILGISDYLPKAGTISSFKPQKINDINALFPIKSMKFTVSNIVKIGIECAPKDLNKLNNGLNRLLKVDPLIKIEENESGQRLISGSGELHLDVALTDLEQNILGGTVKIIKTKPIVSFCETITGNTVQSFGKYIIAKASNKHNRVKLNAEPLSNDFMKLIDNNEVPMPKFKEMNSMKKFGQTLLKNYKFEGGNRIWTFGCIDNNNCRNNILCNNTKGVDYLTEIRDSLCNGFKQGTLSGQLCGENIRGMKIDLLDAKIHSDKSHRKSGVIIPMIKRGMYCAELASKPRLLQPIYEIEIQTPTQYNDKILKLLYGKKGELIDINNSVGNENVIKAYLPTVKSFGFVTEIGAQSSGKAFMSMNFSHWEIINTDPYDNKLKENDALKYILEIRKRKGLKQELPTANEFFDKIDGW